MWGNRGMVTPFTKAQRHFLAGEFEAARDILESLRARGRADFEALTLLGNTYRQLGMLDRSEAILHDALQTGPEHHFPLYGFGRTLLAQGHYTEAAGYIQRAFDAGAPPVTRFDLAHALYRQGETAQALHWLEAAREVIDAPYRLLMIDYLRYRLGAGERPSPEVIEAGLPYWRASAERFAHTPYGRALDEDVQHMLALMKEA